MRLLLLTLCTLCSLSAFAIDQDEINELIEIEKNLKIHNSAIIDCPQQNISEQYSCRLKRAEELYQHIYTNIIGEDRIEEECEDTFGVFTLMCEMDVIFAVRRDVQDK